MEEKQPLLSVSYLPVVEDVIDFRLAVRRMQSSTAGKNALRAVGALLAAAGVLLLALWDGGLFDQAAWCLLTLFGLFAASYHDIVAPYLIRRRANSQFIEDQRILVAQSAAFYEECFSLHTDRYDAHIPYDFLYCAVEDKKQFLLWMGEDEVRFIPKRLLEQEQTSQLAHLLREKLGTRFLNR